MLAWALSHIVVNGVIIPWFGAAMILLLLLGLERFDGFAHRRPTVARLMVLSISVPLWIACSGSWSALLFAAVSIIAFIGLFDRRKARS